MSLFVSIFVLLTVGCAHFDPVRWAMDDEVYADRHRKPYPANDVRKGFRMLEQAHDARFVADRGGSYFGGGWSDDPLSAGAELGVFQYSGPAVEGRAGLKGLIGTGAEDWFAGVDLGARLQSPSRLAPFIGAGTYLGGNNHKVLAIDDHVDNDDDGSVDERGEMKNDPGFLGSVYPELGVHFWITSGLRMTASAQYHITTEGRDADFWFFGLSFAGLKAPEHFKEQENSQP
ncbi:MAG: hypothetical protein R3C49_07710 [Planctomycetaceae bacterium]